VCGLWNVESINHLSPILLSVAGHRREERTCVGFGTAEAQEEAMRCWSATTAPTPHRSTPVWRRLRSRSDGPTRRVFSPALNAPCRSVQRPVLHVGHRVRLADIQYGAHTAHLRATGRGGALLTVGMRVAFERRR
jgi:hypothetical protein